MRIILACLMTCIVVVGASRANAASIVGTWSGEGVAKLTSGHREKLRCRIRYEASTGRTFLLRVNCAHANGTFRQTGRVVKLSAKSYSGRLYSEQYSVSGDVRISVSGNRQTLTATSPKGTARIVLRKR